MVKSPDWSRSELILACALLESNKWRHPSQSDVRVLELSSLLRASPEHAGSPRPDNFRSPGSVRRKLANLLTSRDEYAGARTRGGGLDALVVSDFRDDPDGMRERAEAIRRGLERHEFDGLEVRIDADSGEGHIYEAREGSLLVARVLRRERNAGLRGKKIAEVKARGGTIDCEVCGFNFEATYGERGKGYVEVHHTLPLHVSGAVLTSLQGLALLCSNCHRMVHRGPRWITPSALREVLRLTSHDDA